MVLGAALLSGATVAGAEWTDGFNGLSGIMLPLVLAGVGILTSIMGTFFVRVKEGETPESPERRRAHLQPGDADRHLVPGEVDASC